MKKKYITTLTLFIIALAGILTYISNVGDENITNKNEPNIVEVSTSTEVIQEKKPSTIVAKNPEGEADPERMRLDMKTWNWVNTTYNDGKIITPSKTDIFKLTFNTKNKTFSASTDCNGVGGEYVLNGNKIAFEKMMSTLMYCEGSQEAVFSKSLGQVSSYHFTSKGELVFDLKYDSGVMIFR